MIQEFQFGTCKLWQTTGKFEKLREEHSFIKERRELGGESLFNFICKLFQGTQCSINMVYFTTVYLCPVTNTHSVTQGVSCLLPYNIVAVNNYTKVNLPTWKSINRVDFQNCDCWVKALCVHSVDVCYCLPSVLGFSRETDQLDIGDVHTYT